MAYLADADHSPILHERSHPILVRLLESPVKGLNLIQLRPVVNRQEGEGVLLCRHFLCGEGGTDRDKEVV